MADTTVRFGDFLLLMEQRLSEDGASPADVLDCLVQIDEAFSRSFDPASEFEAYAVVRFCRSMRRVLESNGVRSS